MQSLLAQSHTQIRRQHQENEQRLCCRMDAIGVQTHRDAETLSMMAATDRYDEARSAADESASTFATAQGRKETRLNQVLSRRAETECQMQASAPASQLECGRAVLETTQTRVLVETLAEERRQTERGQAEMNDYQCLMRLVMQQQQPRGRRADGSFRRTQKNCRCALQLASKSVARVECSADSLCTNERGRCFAC